MMVSNRNLLFQGSIFRFHVCFGGCIRWSFHLVILGDFWSLWHKSCFFMLLSSLKTRCSERVNELKSKEGIWFWFNVKLVYCFTGTVPSQTFKWQFVHFFQFRVAMNPLQEPTSPYVSKFYWWCNHITITSSAKTVKGPPNKRVGKGYPRYMPGIYT